MLGNVGVAAVVAAAEKDRGAAGRARKVQAAVVH